MYLRPKSLQEDISQVGIYEVVSITRDAGREGG